MIYKNSNKQTNLKGSLLNQEKKKRDKMKPELKIKVIMGRLRVLLIQIRRK